MTAFSPYGENLFGEPIDAPPGVVRGPLVEEFTIAPFSVLDCRAGSWQDRKRAWLSYGLQSEVGRDARAYNIKEWMADKAATGDVSDSGQSDVSIFDPVLTEMAYRWFCPPDGHVLDPFAGGSVRGIVAGFLGLDYTGLELRAEQVDANEKQADTIAPPRRPIWITADSRAFLSDPDEMTAVPKADLVFTCPPYYDLEVYSNDPADLSNMTYDAFLGAYRGIIAGACRHLAPDRFAAIVVGDVRDKAGHLRNFVSATIDAFTDAGLNFYNEAVVLTSVGTLALRTGKQFRTSRKMGKGHQNLLVFVKGDPRRATALFADATPDNEEDQP